MKYLTFEDRKKIEKMLVAGLSQRAIGRVLKRSHTTIGYEVKINQMVYEKTYNAELAHGRFLQREMNKGNISKLKKDPKLKDFIMTKIITEQWSPEQIAGTLKMRHGKNIICHETIYQFIYS